MELDCSTLEKGVKLIRLVGRLDMSSVLLIEDKFTLLTGAPSDRMLVDLSGVDFMASIGIRLLISNAKAVANRGGRMVLSGAQSTVKKTLQTLGVNELIPMYDKQADALAALDR